MVDPAILSPPPRNSKKRLLSSSSSSSSFLENDVIEIPCPSAWKSKPSKKNSNFGHEIVVVDDDDPDEVVIIGEKVSSNGKGKKPLLYYPAGHEVINLDGAPSPQVNEKQGEPASSSSLYGTLAFSKVSGSKGDYDKSACYHKFMSINSSISKSAPFRSKHSPSKLPTSWSHVKTSGIVQPMPQWPINPASLSFPYLPHNGSAYAQSLHPGNQNPTNFITGNNLILEDDICAEISPPFTDGLGSSSQNSILKKLELFKKFDTLEDHLDHLYGKTKESLKPTKGWANKISDEWKMLEKDLPDTIFVRVYEARMDLLRAVIVGADGTPYHDGLFFFDANFPASYPSKPPLVKYHAHGLRMNPNLYNCGKVCLSLLGTWSGKGDENWRPHKSNMLQVLVSIQGLILNADPYYNEPGYAKSINTSHGSKQSKDYSENVFLLSLKTMLYTIRSPPKYFEDFVYGHFYQRAHDILAACRAYLDGVEVGTFVKGKTQDVQGKRKTCSQSLKMNLPSYIKSLVEAFTKIGVKDCEKFLILADKGTK